jgi:hypothetical protein
MATNIKELFIDFQNWKIEMKNVTTERFEVRKRNKYIQLFDNINRIGIGNWSGFQEKDFQDYPDVSIYINYYRTQLDYALRSWNPKIGLDVMTLYRKNVEREKNLIKFFLEDGQTNGGLFHQDHSFGWGGVPEGYAFWEDVYLRKINNLKEEMPDFNN